MMILRFSTLKCMVWAMLLSAQALTVNSFTMCRVDYPAGSGPQSVFAADLDGDNDFDLVVANNRNEPGGDSVSILFNYGNGAFAAPVAYKVRGAPYSVFAADLDGDSDNDLAVACVAKGADGPDSVSILLNNGNGTFAPMVNYQAGSDPQSVFVADFDGDGDPDLATANRYSGDVSILFNNGNGTFAAPVNYGAVVEPYALFAADLDGDSDIDLAVTDNSPYPGNVAVLLNNGNGTFANPVFYGAGVRPWGIFSADLDGDDDNDLAVANQLSDNVSILLNSGFGTFGVAVHYGAGDNPLSVYGADLEGEDGDVDLAVANSGSDNVSVLFNNGDGTFATAVNFDVGDGPTSVYSADLNGDSVFDLVVANYFSDNVSVLLTNGCVGIRGNVNGDVGDAVNVADLTYLVAFLFEGGPPPPCPEEGDVNGSGGTANVADLTYLTDYLFRGGPSPPSCP